MAEDNADLRLTLQPLSTRHYSRYMSAMQDWAGRLDLAPTTLEEVLFAEAASTRPKSDWAV